MRALLTAVCLCVAGAGCARVEPLHSTIAAEDEASFSAWQRHVAAQFPTELQQEFADALQEMRYNISGMQEAFGHDAIQAALCKRIHAHTVSEVLLLGYDLKLKRLKSERDLLQQAINTNAHLITKPGDDSAASDLEHTRVQQQQRLDADNSEIQRVEGRVLAYGGASPSRDANAAPAAPLDTTPRGDALKQIAVMLQERRDASILKYGGWPVKIDRDGRGLNDDEHRDFLAKKTAGETRGQIVIPIRIKGHLMFFEGSSQAPTLPAFIVSNLTAADRRKFEEDWGNLDAELWARKEAVDLEVPKLSSPVAPLPNIGSKFKVDAAHDLGRGSN